MKINSQQGSEMMWEYLLVAHPDELVSNKISEERIAFNDAYNEKILVRSKPEMLIASFAALPWMEETLIRWLHRVCSQYKSFPVTLNNYSGFPPHTIYARIQEVAGFNNLVAQLKVIDQYLLSNGCAELKLNHRPHFFIAKGLDNSTFNMAMPEYSRKTFHESFLLNELVLLKRRHQFDACSQVNVFRFFPPDTNSYHQVA
jgi:hypothetical protein